nr:hypothetical protein 7 [Gammaproteobacteria bacterium]
MEHGLVNLVVTLAVSAFVAVWLAFVYWQIKLVKRIHVVSRTQHQIPENIFWLKRARMAIESDELSQNLVQKRNFWAAIFVAIIVLMVALIAVLAVAVGKS